MQLTNEQLNQDSMAVTDAALKIAIENREALLLPLFECGPDAVKSAPEAYAILKESADELTELLSWDRQYDQAIALQHQMAKMLPEEASSYLIAAARFQIEMGDVERGLQLLAREAKSLERVLADLLFAETYTWLCDYPKAEAHLRAASINAAALPADRAHAFHLLFQIMGVQKKLPEALEAWEAAREINTDTEKALPELIRMMIHWYQYDKAAEFIARDPIEIRRTFYRTIIECRSGAPKGRQAWDWIDDYNAEELTIGFEEYAESAMRFAAPDRALAVLMSRIGPQDLELRPLMLAGLAFAQQRDIARSRWALGKALRLADIERPRRTRSSSGAERIFDAEARITFGEVPMDPDIRAMIDPYFRPMTKLH